MAAPAFRQLQFMGSFQVSLQFTVPARVHQFGVPFMVLLRFPFKLGFLSGFYSFPSSWGSSGFPFGIPLRVPKTVALRIHPEWRTTQRLHGEHISGNEGRKCTPK